LADLKSKVVTKAEELDGGKSSKVQSLELETAKINSLEGRMGAVETAVGARATQADLDRTNLSLTKETTRASSAEEVVRNHLSSIYRSLDYTKARTTELESKTSTLKRTADQSSSMVDERFENIESNIHIMASHANKRFKSLSTGIDNTRQEVEMLDGSIAFAMQQAEKGVEEMVAASEDAIYECMGKDRREFRIHKSALSSTLRQQSARIDTQESDAIAHSSQLNHIQARLGKITSSHSSSKAIEYAKWAVLRASALGSQFSNIKEGLPRLEQSIQKSIKSVDEYTTKVNSLDTSYSFALAKLDKEITTATSLSSGIESKTDALEKASSLAETEEGKRKEAEVERVREERKRAAAEVSRAAEETARASAEKGRLEADGERKSGYDEILKAHNTAGQNLNDAKTTIESGKACKGRQSHRVSKNHRRHHLRDQEHLGKEWQGCR